MTRRDPYLALVHHALGLKLALELGEPETARTAADELLEALAVAETAVTTLIARSTTTTEEIR